VLHHFSLQYGKNFRVKMVCTAKKPLLGLPPVFRCAPEAPQAHTPL